jgi:hypothetical protein
VRRGQRVKTGGLWLVLLGGGFWYIRDFVAFGTPVPSVRIGIGPVALPSIETRPAYTVAHYATDWHIWDTWFLPALNDSLGPAWWALLGLAALGMAASLAQRSLPALRAVSMLAISVAVVYPFTPHSADGPEGSPYIFSSTLRFFIPAVALGLVMLPLARSLKARTRQRLVLIGFAILTLAALYDSRGQVEDHPVAAARRCGRRRVLRLGPGGAPRLQS